MYIDMPAGAGQVVIVTAVSWATLVLIVSESLLYPGLAGYNKLSGRY
jgi:hypothetical protein